MFDKELAYNVIGQIIETIHVVQKRTGRISTAADFTSSDQRMMVLDSVCMKLAAIGESIKNLDKITNRQLLKHYTQIHWKQAIGMRDIIVHHYFDIDAEVIFKTLIEDIPPLLQVLKSIQSDLKYREPGNN